MAVHVEAWRIAADTPDYGADDLTGAGAKLSGGRWNRKGTPVIYASHSRALACLEVLAHLAHDGLPLNRYLVQILIPLEQWQLAVRFDPATGVGWDALPAGLVSIDWGTQWAQSGASLVALVPSIVVPEETNMLLNPQHPDAAKLMVTKVRRWDFDLRLGKTPPAT